MLYRMRVFSVDVGHSQPLAPLLLVANMLHRNPRTEQTMVIGCCGLLCRSCESMLNLVPTKTALPLPSTSTYNGSIRTTSADSNPGYCRQHSTLILWYGGWRNSPIRLMMMMMVFASPLGSTRIYDEGSEGGQLR